LAEKFVDELIEMFSSDKIREFRQHSKPLYKYYLCGLVNNVIMQGNFWPTPEYGQVKMMSMMSSRWPNETGPGYTMRMNNIKNTLQGNYFHSPERDSQVDMIISFFRKFLHDYKGGKSLVLVKDLEKILDVKKLLNTRLGLKVKDHHWIDIGFIQGLVVTAPEFFNYLDLISLWNDLIEKIDKTYEIHEALEKKDDVLAFPNNPSNITYMTNSSALRELDYSRQASYRALIIQGVNFVESYLYYYFYNIKSDDKYKGQSKILKMKGHIQDKQIVEDLIFKVHNHIASDTKIKEMYEQYLITVDIRDRFVHTSAFVEQSNKMPQLQPLLNTQLDDMICHIQGCVDFVHYLDTMLPADDQLLYWWDRFETPVFTEKNKISVLNVHRQ